MRGQRQRAWRAPSGPQPRLSLTLEDLDRLIELASYSLAYSPGRFKHLGETFVAINRRRLALHQRLLDRRLAALEEEERVHTVHTKS